MISLKKAEFSDRERIWQIQHSAFAPLLEKYQDHDTNPGAESVDKIIQRFRQGYTNYYLILAENTMIGMLRVCDLGETCRLSPICILPEYQGRGYGKQAILLTESLYPHAKRWMLETILQEEKLCRLYGSLGYRKTGKFEKIKDGMDLVYYAKETESK